MIESQKYDKHIIKHLDMELNNTLLNLKKLLTIQNEWARLEDILTAEQKWLDEIGLSLPDLTKTTSNNYVQILANTQVNKTHFYTFSIIFTSSTEFFALLLQI